MTTRQDGPAARPRGRAGRGSVQRRVLAPAKIAAPRLPAVLRRTRLFRRLDRARRSPAVWVVGPPGAGKTTLVASYLADRLVPALWYQVDEGDADPATFFHYLGLAGRRAAPRHRAPLPHLTPEHRPALGTFARRFFRDLYRRLRPPFTLVFDNYQEVPPDALLHEVIREAIAEVTEGGQVMFLSRSDPPPALARQFASQSVAVLGWDDLRLTPEESAGIARLRGARDPARRALPELHAQAQGWVAGLVLLLERAGIGGTATLASRDMALQTLFDYFAGEIFERTDRRTRDLLLHTAFLPSIAVPAATRLSGIADAGRLLADLHRKHYFTERRVDAEAVYQYHPLFRTFLMARASETFGAVRLARVLEEAAALLEEGGQVEDAADLLREARDWQGLGQLVCRHAPTLVGQGRGQTLEAWLADLPTDLLERTPWLLYWLGVCRLPLDTAEARRRFTRALGLFEEGGDAPGFFLAWAGLVETFIYEWGDFTPLDHWIALLEQRLARDPAFPSAEIAARVTFGMFCALMYRQPHHPDLPAWEERVREVFLGVPDLSFRVMVGHHLLFYYNWWVGDLVKAAVVVETLRPLVRSPEIAPLTRIVWHSIEATYLWMSASHEACLRAVEEGLETARASGVHLWDFMLLANGVWGSLTGGDVAAAGEYLARMAAALDPVHGMNVCLYHDIAAHEAFWRGDVAAALEHARTALAQAEKTGMPFAQAMTHVSTARALAELGRYEDGAPHLARAREIGRAMGSRFVDFVCLLAGAKALLDSGKVDVGLERLREGLAVGRVQGLFSHIWFPAAVMARLCATALAHGIEVDYVTNLIRRRSLVPESPPARMEAWPWAVKLLTLGRFAVLLGDEPLRFTGKGQRRPLDLLKALVALGGREVAEERLTEALWPDAEGDAARQAFDTTLHRLRRLLGVEKALALHEGRLSLDARYCWVDTWALERLLAEVDAALSGGSRDAATALPPLVDAVLAIYQGPFLADDPDAAWALPLRERLRGRFVRFVGRVGKHREQAGAWDGAVDCYRRGLEVDELVEEFSQRLMVAYRHLGRQAEALAVYHRCRRALATYLGVTPSPETEALATALRGGR